MLRLLFQAFSGGGGIFILLILGFVIWMFVDALRRREFIWALFICFFSVLSSVLYFFLVYRNSESLGNPLAGFELPGAADRRQIKSLQASIHNLDKAHHHLQLADIYFSQGKLEKAEASYRAAYERDCEDEDIRAHLGTCLAREEKRAEALPLLEGVCAQNPKHDYGYTLMTLAETLAASGETERAVTVWQQVLSLYSYPRARVQYAQLLVDRKETAQARKILEDVIEDEPFQPKFQRKREAVWLARAKALLRGLPG
jgi:hypothetical protein